MDLLNYQLPESLIAQSPAEPRDASRLMVIDRQSGQRQHKQFRDIRRELRPGDLLIVNNTAVFPARLRGHRKNTGGKVEALLLDPGTDGHWTALVKCGGKLRSGERLILSGGLEPEVVERLGGGQWRIRFDEDNFDERIDEHGEIPLPPYIEGQATDIDHHQRYQTVFAEERGAVAAPTAGLHFTKELLEAIQADGVKLAHITLHVGLGTFMPIRGDIKDHEMHAERYLIPSATQQLLKATREQGHRIIACGTTSVRSLESYAQTGESSGETRLFISPPYQFQLVDALITNFHLPQTTLLLLVAAFMGEEALLAAYHDAIAQQYRFYSYGDAMFIQ